MSPAAPENRPSSVGLGYEQVHLVAASWGHFIGGLPELTWLAGVIERDDGGFIMTGPDLMRGSERPKRWALDGELCPLETNEPGVFAVGDVRDGSVKRVAYAVDEESVAVQFTHQYSSRVS